MPTNENEVGRSLEEALHGVVVTFERHGVSYALTGGLAVAQHGVIRATQDVDFLLQISGIMLGNVLSDLKASGFSLDLEKTIREWGTHHMVQLVFQGVRVDWLGCVLPAFRDVLGSTVTRQITGCAVRVASAEGLILLKLIAFRDQDKLDIQGLIAAAGDKIDLTFVRDRLLQIFGSGDHRFDWLEEMARRFGPPIEE